MHLIRQVHTNAGAALMHSSVITKAFRNQLSPPVLHRELRRNACLTRSLSLVALLSHALLRALTALLALRASLEKACP